MSKMLINKKDKIIIISVIIITLIFSMILLLNVFRILKYREGFPKDVIYTSEIKDSYNYEVFLKPNDFIVAVLLLNVRSE